MGAWTSRRMSKYCPARKSVWSGGKTQPRVGQAPRRWKVWARTVESSEAASARREAATILTVDSRVTEQLATVRPEAKEDREDKRSWRRDKRAL